MVGFNAFLLYSNGEVFYLTGAVGLDEHQLLIIFLTEDSRNLARILDLSSGRWRDVTPPPWAAGDQYELFACLATSINGIEESYLSQWPVR